MMSRDTERGRIVSVGSVLLVFLSALTLWIVVSTSGTWGYFSNTLQELASISTGYWDEVPSQSGTSINATKTAQGHWEQVDGTPIFLVYGEICVTNSGEQRTENLTIIDVIQGKPKGAAFEDTDLKIPVDLGEHAVLGPGAQRRDAPQPAGGTGDDHGLPFEATHAFPLVSVSLRSRPAGGSARPVAQSSAVASSSRRGGSPTSAHCRPPSSPLPTGLRSPSPDRRQLVWPPIRGFPSAGTCSTERQLGRSAPGLSPRSARRAGHSRGRRRRPPASPPSPPTPRARARRRPPG